MSRMRSICALFRYLCANRHGILWKEKKTTKKCAQKFEILQQQKVKRMKSYLTFDFRERVDQRWMNILNICLLLVIRFIENTLNIQYRMVRCHVGVGSHCLKQRCSLSFAVFSDFFGSSVYFWYASLINVIGYKRGNVGAQSYCCFQ